MTVTLADVAARAQVSPATVSRVLNGNYPVAAATRERVLRAVDELDYVLNGPASSLAAATSDLVGILVNDIADPFFGIMAGAVQSEIGGRGGRAGGERARRGLQHRRLTRTRTHLPHPPPAPARRRRRPDRRRDRGPRARGRAHREAAAARRRPAPASCCAGDHRAPDTDAIALTFDNRGGGRALTEHLLTLGHRSASATSRAPRSAPPPGTAWRATATRGGGRGGRRGPLTVHGPYDRATGYDGARSNYCAATRT